MFDALPGFWTPVMGAAALTDKPVGLTLAGERIVVFRTGGPPTETGAGSVSALFDRCPHRGVALSLGKVVEGRLECPFHGWQFDGEGRCRHVPFNPGVERAGRSALPTREIGGLIWVFTGLDAVGEPEVPPALLRPGVRIDVMGEEWSTHWTRAMENMLDTPHLPWVHQGTIGSGMRRRMRPDSKMEQELTDADFGFEIRFWIDNDPEPGRLNWRRPNGMELFILEKSWGIFRNHAWCVPTTTDRTLMLVVSVLDFGLLNPILALGTNFNKRVLGEDREVIESSSPTRCPPPNDELHVPTDKPTLRFRTWYHRNLAHLEPAAGATAERPA